MVLAVNVELGAHCLNRLKKLRVALNHAARCRESRTAVVIGHELDAVQDSLFRFSGSKAVAFKERNDAVGNVRTAP